MAVNTVKSIPVSLVKSYAPAAGSRTDERMPHTSHIPVRYRPFIGRWPTR